MERFKGSRRRRSIRISIEVLGLVDGVFVSFVFFSSFSFLHMGVIFAVDSI